MFNKVTRIAVVLAASLGLVFAGFTPAQAASATAANPPCEIKRFLGIERSRDCTRAKAWGLTSDIALKAAKERSGTARSAAMKGAILKVAGTSTYTVNKGKSVSTFIGNNTKKKTPASVENRRSKNPFKNAAENNLNSAIGGVAASISTNQALCMREALLKYTNQNTKNTKLAKDYYGYLNHVLNKKLTGKVPGLGSYVKLLKDSKSTVKSFASLTELQSLNRAIVSCSH